MALYDEDGVMPVGGFSFGRTPMSERGELPPILRTHERHPHQHLQQQSGSTADGVFGTSLGGFSLPSVLNDGRKSPSHAGAVLDLRTGTVSTPLIGIGEGPPSPHLSASNAAPSMGIPFGTSPHMDVAIRILQQRATPAPPSTATPLTMCSSHGSHVPGQKTPLSPPHSPGCHSTVFERHHSPLKPFQDAADRRRPWFAAAAAAAPRVEGESGPCTAHETAPSDAVPLAPALAPASRRPISVHRRSESTSCIDDMIRRSSGENGAFLPAQMALSGPHERPQSWSWLWALRSPNSPQYRFEDRSNMRLVDEVLRRFRTMLERCGSTEYRYRHAQYRWREHTFALEDDENGVYIADCTGFVYGLLRRVDPRGCFLTMKLQSPLLAPTPSHWFCAFQAVHKGGHWQRELVNGHMWEPVKRPEDLQPGDIVVWQHYTSTTSGHLVVVMPLDIPDVDDYVYERCTPAHATLRENDLSLLSIDAFAEECADGWVSVRIADSTSAPHTDDTRPSETTGMGIGWMEFRLHPHAAKDAQAVNASDRRARYPTTQDIDLDALGTAWQVKWRLTSKGPQKDCVALACRPLFGAD